MTVRSKKRAFITGVLFAAVLAVFTGIQPAHAKVDLRPLTQTNLGVQPLDVATSLDGKLVFVLTRKQILVYSLPEKRITNRIQLSGSFDRITYSPEANLLILTSSTAGTLRTIKVEPVFPIDITGHPFKGPANAPVTIVVFDDYQ